MRVHKLKGKSNEKNRCSFVAAVGCCLCLYCCRANCIKSITKIAEPEKAAEVVVIREDSFYGGGKTYRILLDDKEIFDINSGEYTRFKVSHGKHSVGVKCNVSFGIPMTDKIDVDLEPKISSYYFLSKKFQCASIEPKSTQEGEVLVGKSTYRPFE